MKLQNSQNSHYKITTTTSNYITHNIKPNLIKKMISNKEKHTRKITYIQSQFAKYAKTSKVQIENQ